MDYECRFSKFTKKSDIHIKSICKKTLRPNYPFGLMYEKDVHVFVTQNYVEKMRYQNVRHHTVLILRLFCTNDLIHAQSQPNCHFSATKKCISHLFFQKYLLYVSIEFYLIFLRCDFLNSTRGSSYRIKHTNVIISRQV